MIGVFSFFELCFASMPSTILLWLSNSSLVIKILMTGLYSITVVQKIVGALTCNVPIFRTIIAVVDGILGILTTGVLIAQLMITSPKSKTFICSAIGGFLWNINRILSFGLLIPPAVQPEIRFAVRVGKSLSLAGFSGMQFILIFLDK